MKKFLTFIMIALLLFGGVAFAAVETATATLKTSVGETPANSGIRITEITPIAGNSEFDIAFAAAGSTLLMDYTASKNSSIDVVNGTFAVLVKRGLITTMNVTITANPLTNPNNGSTIPYSLVSTTNLTTSTNKTINVTSSAKTDKYLASSSAGALLRHTNEFTYNIPIVTGTTLYGVYSGDIVFTITMP